MVKTKHNYASVLGIAVFYFVFYNSTFKQVYTSSFFYDIRYLIILVMSMLLGHKILNNIKSENILFILSILMLSIFIYLISHDSSVLLFLLFSLYSLYIPIIQIIKEYMYGELGAIILVMGLSFFGILPMKVQLLSFGYDNPNTLAFYITLVCISLFILNWYKVKLWMFLCYFVSMIFCKLMLNNDTAFISLVIFIMLFLFYRWKKYIGLLFRNITIFLPLFATIFSWFLAANYGRYSWIYSLNHLLSNRIEIWNYYLINFPFKFIPQRIELLRANDFIKGFYGNSLSPIMSGAFDGAFFYNLETQGLIVTLLILIALFVAISKFSKYNLYPIIILYFTLFIYSISETVPMAFIDYFQSYLLIITLSCLGNRDSLNQVANFYKEKFGDKN